MGRRPDTTDLTAFTLPLSVATSIRPPPSTESGGTPTSSPVPSRPVWWIAGGAVAAVVAIAAVVIVSRPQPPVDAPAVHRATRYCQLLRCRRLPSSVPTPPAGPRATAAAPGLPPHNRRCRPPRRRAPEHSAARHREPSRHASTPRRAVASRADGARSAPPRVEMRADSRRGGPARHVRATPAPAAPATPPRSAATGVTPPPSVSGSPRDPQPPTVPQPAQAPAVVPPPPPEPRLEAETSACRAAGHAGTRIPRRHRRGHTVRACHVDEPTRRPTGARGQRRRDSAACGRRPAGALEARDLSALNGFGRR